MLRPAHAADVPSLRDIVQDAYRIYLARMGGQEPGPMGDDYAALVAAGLVTVLELEGAIAGLVVLRPAEDHLLLDNVAVAPDFQHRGLGRLLIAHAEAEARRLGAPELRLYTNEAMTENQALYARLGFVETGRAEQAGRRRVFMSKEIPPALIPPPAPPPPPDAPHSPGPRRT